MRKTRRISLTLLVVAVVLIGLFPAIVGAEPPAQDAARGQQLWQQKLCKNCHGNNGEGRYAAPLAGTQRTEQEVIAQVRNPLAQMPAFSPQQVSDAELRDMYAYLRTLQRPTAFTPVRYTAQPNDPPGKVLFNQKRCAACHGENFATGADLARAGRTTLTQAEVTQQIRTPRANMPTFKTDFVTDADIAAITPFLAQQVQQAAAAPAAKTATQPAALPTTGGAPMLLVALASLAGALSLAAGLLLRRVRR